MGNVRLTREFISVISLGWMDWTEASDPVHPEGRQGLIQSIQSSPVHPSSIESNGWIGWTEASDPVSPERRRGLIHSIQIQSIQSSLHRVHPNEITDLFTPTNCIYQLSP